MKTTYSRMFPIRFKHAMSLLTVVTFLVVFAFCTVTLQAASIRTGRNEVLRHVSSSNYPAAKSRARRSLWNFGGMLACAIPNVGNPVTAAARYTNYGCWCGVGGSGAPVDAIDRCCQVHDGCYDATRGAGCDGLKFLPYNWECKAGGRTSCGQFYESAWDRLLSK